MKKYKLEENYTIERNLSYGEKTKHYVEVLLKQLNAKKLHRIVALRDIPRHGVKKGDLGGYIENEDNLSQEGDCWIAEEAIVCDFTEREGDYIYREDKGSVVGNGIVTGQSIVAGGRVEGAVVGDALLIGKVIVTKTGRVEGNSIAVGWSYEKTTIEGEVKGFVELLSIKNTECRIYPYQISSLMDGYHRSLTPEDFK